MLTLLVEKGYFLYYFVVLWQCMFLFLFHLLGSAG